MSKLGPMAEQRLLTTAEVAERLGVSPRTIVRMIHRGDLKPAQKVPHYRGAYLFDEATIRAYEKSAA